MRIALFTCLLSLTLPMVADWSAPLPHPSPPGTEGVAEGRGTLHLYIRQAQQPRSRPQITLPAGPQIDLNGLWTGVLLQNAGGIAERFDLSMQLVHNGVFLKGTAFVKHQEIWAEMEVSGFQQPNGSWKLTDIKVLRAQKPEELSWCEKSYELRASFTPEGVVLHGPWWGNSEYGPCVPGSIRLKRKLKSA